MLPPDRDVGAEALRELGSVRSRWDICIWQQKINNKTCVCSSLLKA